MNRILLLIGVKDIKKVSQLLLILTLLLPLNALNAGTTGKISGKIVDKETSEPILGANILIEGTYFGAAADVDGYYYMNNIPPGKYTVIASAVGFHKVRVENVAVRIDLTTSLDIELTSEAINIGEIVIQAKAPLITKDLTSSSAIVSSEDIKMMPVENISQVINLQAGVVAGHFRGGRSDEVAYLVDGVPVNDAFNGSSALTVENNSVRELEVISGTFNAEYGKALSGIVNIVTKDGSQRYEGFASAYVGNYFTTHNDIFYNLNKVNTNGPKDLQFGFSGPTKILNGLTFFLTGRYFKSDGYMYGRRFYNNDDKAPITFSEFPDFFINRNTGDSAYVAMNPEENKSFNGKLTYGLEKWKINYSLYWDDHWNKYYNHGYRFAPDAIKNHYRTNISNNLQISFFPTQSTFVTLKLATNLNKYSGYLYPNEFDSRYVDPNISTPLTSYTFNYGGNETDRYNRSTQTNIAIFAIESQVSKEHKIKLGAEYTNYKIYNEWKNIKNQTEGQILVDSTGNPVLDQYGESIPIFTIGYTNPRTGLHEKYEVKPYEFSAYIQDKMEYDIMIINAGVRFDYFDPNTTLPVDIRNPLNNPNFPGAFQTRKAKTEYQVSPRLGVSFPITTEGAIHFSYGHFFQIPTFENLYTNNAYVVDQTSGVNNIIGNPELKAQKTVKYELGIQQVLFPNISLDMSVYYSDIRNLLGTEILNTYEGFSFARYINRDYGNVKGLVVTIEKRYSDMFSAKVDYTYQVAQGNASDPNQVFNNSQSDPPVETTKKLVPLNWDQSSTLNISLTVGDPLDWTTGLIFSYGSGTPYTEDSRYTRGLRFENNGTKPTSMNVDLKGTKNFDVFGLTFNTYLLIYNLFDIKNEYGVSASTGRAGIDLRAEEYTSTLYGLNTKHEYLLNPQDYSAPRQIRLGFGVGF